MDETIDRISNLPCNVINDILKYLPLHEAVRTSILSRKWRCRWLTIPHLQFDGQFRPKLFGVYNIESVIYQVLLLHKGPILKFTYNDTHHLKCSHALDHWLQFLSNHCIEKLKLGFYKSMYTWTIAHHLFTFYQLKHLYLSNCKLRPPSIFKGFERLIRLHLSDVLIEPAELARLISKCPMLEQLYLRFRFDDTLSGFSKTFVGFEIDAPNLKLFRFWGKLPFISFKNTSVLEEVFILLDTWASYKCLQTNLIEFIGQLSFIKKLELRIRSLEWLAGSGVPQKLPDNLSHLWFLHLDICFESIADATCAICLIRSSPNLRSLEITSEHGGDDLEPALQFLKTEQECKLNLNHLEKVEIYDFRGSEPEMEFVKLLLAAATALLKLEVQLYYFLHRSAKEDLESRVTKQLAKFCRASSIAEIIIL